MGLPDNEVFRKQREWVSNYLYELSNKGANSRADLNKSERQIQRIKAELRQNNKPTSQSAQSRNRRAKQEEKQDADVISAISMDIQRRIASPPAGTVIFLVITTGIILKEKIEEEVRVEEEQEEEMSLLLDKEV